MVKGQLDISAFPLDYASGRHPQFSSTLMPGLVKNHDHALPFNKSAFMADIKKIVDTAGDFVTGGEVPSSCVPRAQMAPIAAIFRKVRHDRFYRRADA